MEGYSSQRHRKTIYLNLLPVSSTSLTILSSDRVSWVRLTSTVVSALVGSIDFLDDLVKWKGLPCDGIELHTINDLHDLVTLPPCKH